MADIELMTLAEYKIRMEAYHLRRAERAYDIASQAWLNQAVKMTTGGKKPKPKFKTFKAFYDREGSYDAIRTAFEPNYQRRKPARQLSPGETFAKRMADFQRLRAEGKIISLSEGKERIDGRKL